MNRMGNSTGNKIFSLVIFSICIVLIYYLLMCIKQIYLTSSFSNIDMEEDIYKLLEQKTRIWGDLNDDQYGIIQRMTEPGIEYQLTRRQLKNYQDIIA